MQSPVNAPARSTQGVPVFQSRRQNPRVHVKLPVTVVLDSGKRIATRSRDVSLTSLSIVTDRPTAAAIHPSGRVIREADCPSVAVSFPVRVGSERRRVEALCEICRFDLCDDDSVLFALRLVRLSRRGATNLEAFVESSLEPAY